MASLNSSMVGSFTSVAKPSAFTLKLCRTTRPTYDAMQALMTTWTWVDGTTLVSSKKLAASSVRGVRYTLSVTWYGWVLFEDVAADTQDSMSENSANVLTRWAISPAFPAVPHLSLLQSPKIVANGAPNQEIPPVSGCMRQARSALCGAAAHAPTDRPCTPTLACHISFTST